MMLVKMLHFFTTISLHVPSSRRLYWREAGYFLEMSRRKTKSN